MIDHKKERILWTNDTRMGQAEHDFLEQEEGQIITPEELIAFTKLAYERKLEFDVVALAGMTMERALRIKQLRSKLSWRAVATITHDEWGAEAMWEPPTNQIAGMALCETAAKLLQEDYKKFPWQAMQ